MTYYPQLSNQQIIKSNNSTIVIYYQGRINDVFFMSLLLNLIQLHTCLRYPFHWLVSR